MFVWERISLYDRKTVVDAAKLGIIHNMTPFLTKKIWIRIFIFNTFLSFYKKKNLLY